MNFELQTGKKQVLRMRANFAAVLLYRRIFLADMIKDMTELTQDGIEWDDVRIDKLFGIIWCFIKNREPETPDYLEWKKAQPELNAIEIVKSIQTVWVMASTPLIENTDAETPQRDDLQPSLALYLYLARKMGISVSDFSEMIPGEVLDIANYEAVMQEVVKDPTYKAAQNDYDEFFSY